MKSELDEGRSASHVLLHGYYALDDDHRCSKLRAFIGGG